MRRHRVKKVVYKKMRGAWGEADDGVIYIDPRAKGLKHLEIMCHETTHVLDPKKSEEDVSYYGAQLAVTLWNAGYRRITSSDTSVPLQDGSEYTKRRRV